jgi:hypothetical protein
MALRANQQNYAHSQRRLQQAYVMFAVGPVDADDGGKLAHR